MRDVARTPGSVYEERSSKYQVHLNIYRAPQEKVRQRRAPSLITHHNNNPDKQGYYYEIFYLSSGFRDKILGLGLFPDLIIYYLMIFYRYASPLDCLA